MFALIESIQRRDPAQPTFFEVILGYPGFHVLTVFHPFARFLWKMELHALARFWSNMGRILTGIDIHPQAQIGRNLFIDHGTGVVIGQTSIIGDDCTIYQGVTLGGKGNVLAGEKRHPTLGNNVMIGANAQVLGNIRIGNNARIGANAVVTGDVADSVTMVGNPARVLEKHTAASAYGLPEGECSDPALEKLCAVEAQLEEVRKLLK